MAIPAFKIASITAIIDRNRIQATGPTAEIMPIPDIEEKWRSFGWKVSTVDGHDVGALRKAFDAAAAEKERPSLIVADTVKGRGVSFAENTAAFHNGIMSKEQHALALAEIDKAIAGFDLPSGPAGKRMAS